MKKKEAQALTYSAKNLPKEKYAELGNYIEGIEEKKGSLISVLHKAQSIFGYLPMEVQTFVARKLDMPAAEVFGVASFYSYFSMLPLGNHAEIGIKAGNPGGACCQRMHGYRLFR